MRKIYNFGLQNGELLHAKMKANIQNSAIWLFALTLLTGCFFNTAAYKTPLHGNAAGWRHVEPTRIFQLVVAGSGDGGYCFTNLVVIDDTEFVRSLFNDLAQREPVIAVPYLMVAPKLFVFADARHSPVASFLYWPAGRPEHIFASCKVDLTNKYYWVDRPGSRGPSVVLPGFGERMRRYVDVWR